MDIPIDSELVSICDEIVAKGIEPSQWAAIESGDMFQFSLEIALEISNGKKPIFIGRLAK